MRCDGRAGISKARAAAHLGLTIFNSQGTSTFGATFFEEEGNLTLWIVERHQYYLAQRSEKALLFEPFLDVGYHQIFGHWCVSNAARF
jgi:hypothetical protein